MGDHKLIRANVAGVFWSQHREFNIARKEDKGGSRFATKSHEALAHSALSEAGMAVFEAMELQETIGNQLFQVLVFPLEKSISWRVASRAVSRVRLSLPGSMNFLVQS